MESMGIVDLKAFRKANNLKQEDVSGYLDTSRVFISQVESGKSKLPSEQLEKLLSNPYGWDTTALTSPAPTISTKVSGNGKANVQVGDNNHMDSDTELKMKVAVLEKENELLKEQIDFLKSLLQK
jgi:transcriptional regulator with XRE-family HTH domain